MSEVRLIVCDAEQEWSGTIHGSDANLALAALSADPVTLAEFEAAVARFVKPCDSRSFFANLRRGGNDEPWDAGLVVIELVARLVVVDSTYSAPGPVGGVFVRGQDDESDVELSYHLDEDWLFVNDALSWRGMAQARRKERSVAAALDARAVLYGPSLLEFVARESLSAYQQSALTPAKENADNAHETIKNIHATWLLTPRDDLRNESPREVLLRHRDHLSWDLQDRSEQWSLLDACPPSLPITSFAFRNGGFGTHELVMYYELVRELLWSSWDQLEELAASSQGAHLPEALSVGDFLTTEVPRLAELRDAWLDSPHPEHHLRTPRSIIDRERRRIPEAISGKDAMVDADCPCCQMMADMPGPVFWNLDGSGMDDDFAFDIYHRTREEWDAEQRKWAEYTAEFNAKQAERERLKLTGDNTDENEENVPWTSSFSADNTDAPLTVRVFGLGCRLAEIISDLREGMNDGRTSLSIQLAIDELNRSFGNVRETLEAELPIVEALIEPVTDRFADILTEVGSAHSQVKSKCEALGREVFTLFQPTDDIPY